MKTTLHFDNDKLKPLRPFYISYLKKGLDAVKEGKNRFDGTIVEKYAHDICARVHEIDNGFQNLRLCLEYLEKTTFPDSAYNFSVHHSFHIENFLLRLTGIVDRSHLVAGTSILLKKKSIEKIGGNKKIIKELKEYSIEAVDALNKMNDAVNPLRDLRNKVAHQFGYSNNNLNMLGFISDLEDDE